MGYLYRKIGQKSLSDKRILQYPFKNFCCTKYVEKQCLDIFFPPSSLCSLFLLFHRGNSNASSKVNRVCPHAPSRGGHVQTANYHRLDCHQPTAKVKRTVTHPGYKLPSIVIDHQISPSLWLSNTPNDARILASVREHLVWIYVRFTLQRQIVTFFLTM